jgi:hypothetical protein
MKKFFAILMLSSISLVALAQEPPVTPKPVIYFESTVYDYGTIARNANGTCYFKFINNGDAPLILTQKPVASCGCTTPSAPVNVPILPGQTDSIGVHYDTRRGGAFNKSITVYSNSGNVTLIIKGNVQ